MIGRTLSQYRITAAIGAGGMGEVYRATDTRLGRDVAIKVLPAATASDPDRRQRFEQEARAASALNHPNILTVYDIAETDGTIYIAMELVEGKTLRELMASGEPLPTKRLLDIAVQTAEGLAKAHSVGIVHRDLKPENVMVSKDGYVKILDFGLAKLTEPVTQDATGLPTAIAATAPGTVLGTAGYMSPEQASGYPVDFRSDQFSLGAILYEMTIGQARVPEKDGRRDARRDHPGGARAARPARIEDPGSDAVDRRAPAREGSRGALRLDEGSRARRQERPRPSLGDIGIGRARGRRACEIAPPRLGVARHCRPGSRALRRDSWRERGPARRRAASSPSQG